MSKTLEITVPAVGESIASGILTSWNVEDGGFVEKGQPLFELETDKASTEVPALESGVVRHMAQPGDEVAVGAIVGRIEIGEKKSSAPAKQKAEPAAKAVESNGPAVPPPQAAVPAKPPAVVQPASAGAPEESRVVATSVARKVAEDHGIELSAVSGSGTGGRITREDVEAEVARRSVETAPAKSNESTSPPVAVVHATSDGPDQTREKMSMLRRRIAERLVEAQHNAAMLTTFNDVDMSAVLALRSQYKEAFKEKHGVGLGFMSFFVGACVEALRAFPRVNAFIDGNEIVYNHRHHIGVAVSTDRGLIVPVVRDAGGMSFARIEQAIVDFAKRARDNKIEISELQGGTFTISNGGVFGSMLSTPILNPPQSAILGMHRIEERPVARDGQVVIRPMMYLAMSYDHRIVDGKEAVSFLVRVKECIENPARLLLSV